MRDVVKQPPAGSRPQTSGTNGANGAAGVRPKRRRRKRNLSLYYLMIFLICGFILFLLSRTLLFRVKEYVVTGNSRYTVEQILDAADLKVGKNMYNIDTDKVEQKIKDELIYIENVTVRRKLPDKMTITVEEAEPFACCQYEGSRYAVITRSGRYLETEQASPRAELLQIYGLDLVNVSLGEELESEDPNKLTIVMQLLDAMDEICPGKVSYIDITDRTDIMIGYAERIDIEFGSSLDYEYKLRYVSAIIENNLSDDETGRLIYHSAAAGVSFITNEDLQQMQEDLAQREEQQANQQQSQESTETGQDVEEPDE